MSLRMSPRTIDAMGVVVERSVQTFPKMIVLPPRTVRFGVSWARLSRDEGALQDVSLRRWVELREMWDIVARKAKVQHS